MKEIPENLKQHEEFLRSTEKTALEINCKRGHTLPWESKCGGCPYLESEDDYPRDQDGQPMMFLAQLNLDEMPHLEDFPEHGLLQFYINDEGESEISELGRVIYIPEYKKDASGLLSVNPFEENYQGRSPITHEGKMGFQLSTRFIGSDCPEFIDKILDKLYPEYRDELEEMERLCDASGSIVGGYPKFIDWVPDYYKEGKNILLLQLGNDFGEECGIDFGDSGCCYFLISKEDLKNKNFDQVEYGWQCC